MLLRRISISKHITLIVAILVYCFTLQAQSQQKFLSFKTNEVLTKVPDKPHRLIPHLSESNILINYEFSGATVTESVVENELYQLLSISGLNKMTQSGVPALPVHNEFIALPPGSVANLEILSSEYIEYSSFNIRPALKPARDTEGYPEPDFEKDNTIYGHDAFFPETIVSIKDIYLNRGIPIAVTQVSPVQFNPLTGTIRVYSKIEFKITYLGGESFEKIANRNSKHFTDLLKRNVLNSDNIPDGIAKENLNSIESTGSEYIIITHSQYIAQAEQLANWKRQLGYTVEVVSSSSWTATNVKNEIQTRYNNWSPAPDYFVIIGDHDGSFAVPGEIHYTGDNPPEPFATDLYYACMDGTNDWHPDMAHGRISVSNTAEAQTVIDKIINYEKTPPNNTSFYDNVLNCAQYQDDDNNGYADRRFCHTSEDIRDYLQNQGYTSERVYYTSTSANVTDLRYNNTYYSNGGLLPPDLRSTSFNWNGGSSEITSAIDAGKFVVFHRDHGYVGGSGWAHPYYTTSSMASLSNGDLLPIVFSMNCHTGEFQLNNCFAEKFVRMSGKGAVGVVAAAYYSYSGYNDALSDGMIDAIWSNPGLYPVFGSAGTGNNYTIGPGNDIYTMGDVVNQGLYAMEQNYGGGSAGQYQYELFHWFGDPAMNIWTSNPNTDVIVAAHNTTIDCNGTNFAVSGSTADAIATLVYNNEILGETILDGSGNGNITYLMTTPGDSVTLTISKHNHYAYVDELEVVGACNFLYAEFTADNSTIIYGNAVNFTDISYGAITSWGWTFPGGNPATYSGQTPPPIQYDVIGTYDVTLTVCDATDCDTTTKTDYINVTDVGCDYQIALYDSYGDGWNGGNVTVFVDGISVLNSITVASGSGPEYHTFAVSTGAEITTTYTAGGWPYENTYEIIKYDGAVVYTDGDFGTTAPTGIGPGLLYGMCAAFGEVEGYVYDGSAQPIDGATVITSDSLYSTITDATGYYVISSMPAGWYTLVSSKVGYNQETDSAYIISDSTLQHDFTLTQPSFVYNPVLFNENLNPDQLLTTYLSITNNGDGDGEWSAMINYGSKSCVHMISSIQTGQPNNYEVDKNAKPREVNSSRATWDLQFAVDLTTITGSAGNAGAESDGVYVYATRWASNLIEKFTIDGTFIEEFSIPGVSGLRDLAYDGQYFYGGAAGTTVYVMDFDNQTLVTSFTAPTAVRSIAYDERADAFWANNLDTDMVLFDDAGTQLNTISGIPSSYGSAYDDVTDGGPYLWLFTGTSNDGCQIEQMEIATESLTGVVHDVSGDIGATIAGGLYITENLVTGTYTIGGTAQGDGANDTGFGYELGDNGGNWLSLSSSNGTVLANGGSQTLDVNFDATGKVAGEVFNANIVFTSNPNIGTTTIPVTMTIAGGSGDPDINVDPTNLNISQTNNFTIENTGVANLSITSITDDATWLSTSGYPGTPFSVSPSNNQNVDLIVDWNLVGNTTQVGIVTILSNDPDEPSVTVTVTADPNYSHFVPIWSGYPYQPMNILLTTATLDGVDLNIGDEIGVFDVEGSGVEICVGMATINQAITYGTPLSITVSSDDPNTTGVDGFTTGNTIVYRAWSTNVQTEYSTFQATYNSAFDNVFNPLGTALVDVAFISSITQTIILNQGWNIISYFVEPGDMNLLTILDPLVVSGELTKVINEAGGFIQYIPGVGWMNTIGDMANTEGYYLKVNQSTQLEATGVAVTLPFDIPLSTGWNIMGYPVSVSQDAIQVLQPLINSVYLQKVIDEAGGFIQNIPGVGWMNTIGDFEPGEGYYIKLSTNTTLTIN